MRATWAVAVAVAIGTALAPAPAGAVTHQPAALSQAPAYPRDFPDPFVLYADGAYWAYSTGSGGRNLQVMSSPDLVHWTAPVDPLPTTRLPSWASIGSTWAPGVIRVGGQFVMYYTVHDVAAGRQCISTAVSATPGGPFSDGSNGPLVCQLDHGGSIDPNPFRTPSGALYLLWKSDDNAIRNPTNLWSQPLTADGLALTGSPTRLLTESWWSPWQAPAIEGPTMVAFQGTYYLFYGGGNWDSSAAAMGYATCRSASGPCANQSVWAPWVGSHGLAVGPSGPSVFALPSGGLDVAYHAWTGGVGYQNGGVRSLWIDTLGFSRGRPVLG
jgi:beta-xylosidase